MIRRLIACLALSVCASGCGTTRWSDTARTATEQMLMSDAIDRSISQIDFSVLAGREVFLDGKYIAGLVDEKYVMSTLRQHLFASGCIVKDKPEDAAYMVEVRAGALGTNRNDLLFGIPATNLPTGGGLVPLAPSAIPELSFMKRTAQQGVCKVAIFAYDRSSGQPVWQSGVRQQVSKAKDVWVLGTGPFQHGTIYNGTKFAGEGLHVPLGDKTKATPQDNVSVAKEILFREPTRTARLPAARTSASSPAPAETSPTHAPPAVEAPPPSVVTTSAFGGATQPAPSAAGAPGDQQSSPPTAGAYGAIQALDWARTARQSSGTAR